MSTDSEMKRDPAVLNGIMIGIVSLLLLLLILLGLETLYYTTNNDEEAYKLIERAPVAAAELQREQRERLAGFRRAEGEDGVVSIPIDEAMRLVVADPDARQLPPPAPAPEAAQGDAGEAGAAGAEAAGQSGAVGSAQSAEQAP